MNSSIESIRSMYLRYFGEREHALIGSASLVADGDPSVLFTTAGMHPLVPYLMGQPHPAGRRLVGYQGCLRTNDIDAVGDDTHLTFFEMLGNWSLSDYGKRDSIGYSFEFLTSRSWLALDPGRLWVTVYAGDATVGRDEDAAEAWRDLGLPTERIVYLREDNWWAAGPQGPCGPDTEIFYDRTGRPCSHGRGCHPGGCECGRFVEIWNNVFMDYQRQGATLHRLPGSNVDTGMGLERISAVLGGHPDVYRCTTLEPVMLALCRRSGLGEDVVRSDVRHTTGIRVLTDHLRSAVMVLGDPCPVEPSNQGAGYVVRRLIRRAIRYCERLSILSADWVSTAEVVVEVMGDAYPSLTPRRLEIVQALAVEAGRFEDLRTKGEGLLRVELDRTVEAGRDTLPGEVVFRLHERFGFPMELTRETAREHGLRIDEPDYDRRFTEHRRRSRSPRATSGLVDTTHRSVQLHTATHLLHAALRSVLGPHVEQRGSNITPERLRFDFTHPRPMTPKELERTQRWVQHIVDLDLRVSRRVTTVEEARRDGALGLFADRYDERVSLYAVGDVSAEICSGPHVERTGELGRFRIVKEQSSSAGVRRIRAVLEESARFAGDSATMT